MAIAGKCGRAREGGGGEVGEGTGERERERGKGRREREKGGEWLGLVIVWLIFCRKKCTFFP